MNDLLYLRIYHPVLSAVGAHQADVIDGHLSRVDVEALGLCTVKPCLAEYGDVRHETLPVEGDASIRKRMAHLFYQAVKRF